MKLTELLLNRFLYKDNLQNLETKDSSYNAGNVIEAEVPAIASGGAAQDINTSNVTINGQQLTPGTYPVTVLDVSNWGWGQTCVFSSTDLDTVSWTLGVFKSADGVSYNITAGNTGNMAAKTYIYLDLNVSATAYQVTTTPANAVGIGKVLIAVAQNATAGNLATYNLSEATQIVGDNILANTINASKITTGQLIVGTNVGLGTAQDAGQVTTIVGNTITTGYVNALGITVLGAVTAGSLNGLTITGGTIQTSTSGKRVVITSAGNDISFYDVNDVLQGQMFGLETGSGVLWINGVNGISLVVGAASHLQLGPTSLASYKPFYPSANNTLDIGIPGLKWRDIYLAGSLYLEETGAGTDMIEISAPASCSAYTFTLPSDGGTAGYVLSTDGSGGTSWVASSSGATTALDNLASVAINTSLLPGTDNSINLGSSSKSWANLYVDGSGIIYGSSDILFDLYENGAVLFGSATSYTDFSPYDALGCNLGQSTKRWATVYADTIDTDTITVTTNISMSTAYIDGVTAIYFDDRSTAPGSPGNGTMYAYTSGGTYQMRVYLNGAWYSFDLTAV